MPQSAELGGGAGFTYEGYTAAYYLAAMLDEAHAPGIADRAVVRVGVQRREMGEQLDDVIVDFRDRFGELARLSLQVKRVLTVSMASSNADFRAIIRDCRDTRMKTGFRPGVDRYGVAVGTISADKFRAVNELCEIARASPGANEFSRRFGPRGNAPADVKAVHKDIAALLDEFNSGPCPAEHVSDFLMHFLIIQFDFLHSGATKPPDAVNLIRNSLEDSRADDAPLVWSRLVEWARAGAGRSEQFDRQSLVSRLSPLVRLRGAPSLRADLEKLTRLASSYTDVIQDDIGGERLGRDALVSELDEQLAAGRLVQIRGSPGSGKSVLLRKAVARAVEHGPVLFLKADQLEGKSWSSFAVSQGLSGAPIEALLVEIGATGTPILFVDAIDRIDTEHQPVLLDVVRTIIRSDRLDGWRIVVTLRDSGVELLRNWLRDLLDAVTIRSVEVGLLSDPEAETLATAKPHLRPLLFGPLQVRAVVRRPFFAKVLDQGFVADPGGPAFTPQSEIDLIENWWRRGGYNAAGQVAIERQRAIVDLARVRTRQMSLPIRYAQLSSINRVGDLIEDGVLQEARAGHSVRFAHDIFFEWSLFSALVDLESDWIEEVRAAGEPPAVGRVVELLSQAAYAEGPAWTQSLALTEATGLRSQWTRAWLIGPLGSPVFDVNRERFEAVTLVGNFEVLRKVLVWFQAEKTTPNASVLAAGHISPNERQRFADLMGWPSDFVAWRRLITFLLDHIATIPVRLYPDVVAVFEVWQNACSDYANPLSARLIAQVADWLRELDAIRAEERPTKASKRWTDLPHHDDFRSSLARMILKASASEPQPVTHFLLRRIADRESVREKEFAEIIMFSPKLARTHAQHLIDLTSGKLRQELPDDRFSREQREAEAAAECRKAVLAKPAAERTRLDKLMIESPGLGRIGPDFSLHDWRELSIEQTFEPFSPPSPLREPFRSLFQSAPDRALRLLRELSNHAITAWRQLHRRDYDRRGTPIPLEVVFPWGRQTFWGTEREYLWCRGTWAPDPVACGFLALEDWCFEQLAADVPLDNLLRRILEGHESVAVLGTAVTVALQTEAFSEAVLPLVGAQRLWAADHERFAHDLASSSASLIGFTKATDRLHIEAIRVINGRAVRKKQLRWLAQRYVVFGGDAFSERARNAIAGFKDSLPYLYEEWRAVPETGEALLAQALEYEEAAHPANYRLYRAAEGSEDIVVVHESPTATTPESVARFASAHQSLEENAVWLWVVESFKGGRVGAGMTVSAAVAFASRVAGATLFEDATTDDDGGLGIRRGSVAGAAAVALSFREGLSAGELDWARSILKRAYEAPETRDAFWSPYSIIPWHETIFVARGLAADIRAGTQDGDAAGRLLRLVGHPLEAVSLAAFKECCQLWSLDARLAWAAIHVGFALCIIKPRPNSPGRGGSNAVHSPEDVREVLERADAVRRREPDWELPPGPPPAWVRAGFGSTRSRRPRSQRGHDHTGHDPGRPEEAWGEPDTSWYSQYAAKLLPVVPVDGILASDARAVFLDFVAVLLDYTNQRNAPPWAKSDSRERPDSRLYEWTHELGRTLGRLAGRLPLAEFRPRFLDPVLALDDDSCWAVLHPLANRYICAYVFDDKEVPDEAVSVLGFFLERLLSAHVFNPKSYRAGELSGFDLPGLVETLMFVSIERADGAARYVNGDWSEINRVLPLVDRFVRAAGWSSSVMSLFLTLCERARSNYPAEAFADQVLAIFSDETRPFRRWHGTFLPARIAELVQHFASRNSPLLLPLAQKFLRVLDALVDMGDRRSAALQQSEAFREIRVGA